MSSSYNELFEAALALPAGSRAMLAEHLLESLDDPEQKTRDLIWAQEADQRAAEIETVTRRRAARRRGYEGFALQSAVI